MAFFKSNLFLEYWNFKKRNTVSVLVSLKQFLVLVSLLFEKSFSIYIYIYIYFLNCGVYSRAVFIIFLL